MSKCPRRSRKLPQPPDAPTVARKPASDGSPAPTRAAVVLPWERPDAGPDGSRDASRAAEARLAEAVGLAASIGLIVVHSAIVPLRARRPSTLFGKGQLETQHEALTEADVEVAIVDSALSPVQQRNLERAWGCKVIDRTGLILDIFGERAATREGSLQVELAHLDYQRSRLVRSWTHLERQRGGFGFLGGPGESQIEADRRLIDDHIVRLKKGLEQVRRTRGLHRRQRRKAPFPVVALVGYTNAGKSTLFNALTGAGVAARDQLFATLDPTMRGLKLPSGRRAILSDTVGFISELPTELVEAFRATLEEVAEADVILHVRDAAHPDTAAQRADVVAVLDGMARDGTIEPDWNRRTIEVLNKADLLGGAAELAGRAGVPVSAITGEGLADLLAAIDERIGAGLELVEYDIEPQDGARLAWLYQHGEVVARDDADAAIHVTVRLLPADRARFERPAEGRRVISAAVLADLDALLREAAAAEIMPRFRNLAAGDVRAKSGPLDLVTEADVAAERVIAAGLERLLPGCFVLGEEAASEDPSLLDRLADAPLAVVVDPIDGTSNFAAGVPLFGAMAAIIEGGEVVASVIHDPVCGDSVLALRGQGAWREAPDGARTTLRVADPAPAARMSGAAAWRHLPASLRTRVASHLPRVAQSFDFRCAAVQYRMAASGDCHYLLFNRLLPWDHAPGWLLHQEAGGWSAHFDGSQYVPAHFGGGLICAPDRASWQELRTRCWRFEGAGMLDRHTLSNAYLTCVVKADGAELCSLRDAVDQELLWQAGPAWPRHAPVLFPIVGRLMNDTLLHRGQTYRMTQHGFARDRRFAWLDRKATSCTLVLKDDPQTHGTYPFAFRLEVSFTLDDDSLVFAATVINPGRETLPASLGAHPAFLWPISGDGDKSGHSIEFERAEPAPIRRLRDGLLLEERFPSPVEGQTLHLDPALFDADAIILDAPESASLRYTAPGSPRIEISWEGAAQLGLWSRRDGEFVCIEPWHGFASPVGFEGEFETKPGLMLIPPGERRTLSYRVRVV